MTVFVAAFPIVNELADLPHVKKPTQVPPVPTVEFHSRVGSPSELPTAV